MILSYTGHDRNASRMVIYGVDKYPPPLFSSPYPDDKHEQKTLPSLHDA